MSKKYKIKTLSKKKKIFTDLLNLENADNLVTGLWTSHHSVCWHESQVAGGKLIKWHWGCLVGADQLIVIRVHTARPLWTVAFTKGEVTWRCVRFCRKQYWHS